MTTESNDRGQKKSEQDEPEIAARGNVNLLDLGVAWFSGMAAAYAGARPKLAATLAGVAIAAALVPPLSVVGIAAASGE